MAARLFSPAVTRRSTRDLQRKMRLSAQRLLLGADAADELEAVRAVVGVQAQDLRAAALQLRSRVLRLDRETVTTHKQLVRMWTVRGTVHMIDLDDRDWLHAAMAARNLRAFDAIMRRRGALETANAMLPDVLAALEREPRDRASLLAEIGPRHGDLGTAINVLVPWMVGQGRVLGLPDGRLRLADLPVPVDEEEALATLARRYLAGYGPADAADLAAWSGLGLQVARRALQAVGPLETIGELYVLPGTLDAAIELPDPPPLQLLGAFDTLMLGWRSRELHLQPEHDRMLHRSGGMIRPVVLTSGRVAGFWRIAGSGSSRQLEVEWIKRPTNAKVLAEEVRSVGRFLGIEIRS